MADKIQVYPMYEAQGTHRELGRRHGEQCRAQVHGFLDYLGKFLGLSRSALRERALRFLPLLERHCPHLVEEVHGLAEGASVSFAEALAVQVRGELGQVSCKTSEVFKASEVSGEGCTTFVISARGTADGQVLIGQNSDVEPELEEFAYVLRLKPADKPAVLMWTFGGQLGYHGLNGAGVGHFANSLGGGPAWKFGLPHYPIKRMMLEQRTLAGVLGLLERVPVCSNGNYVLCDGDGQIADVELSADGFAVMEDGGEGFIAHSNHYLCAQHASPANDAASLPDSFPRLDRMRQMITESFGRITVDDLKRMLADHAGYPTSICRHPHEGPDHPSCSARGKTTAALIAEPEQGRLHVACGNPCQVAFATYEL